MRFHVVGLPFEPQPQCAYGGKHDRFVTMMRDRGHIVYEYRATPDEWDPARAFEPGNKWWRRMNLRVMGEIAANAEPTDFLCLIAGRCQQPIADWFPEMQAVEYGVGYGGVFAPYRVFESYAWMHMRYGADNPDPHTADGQFYDTVIPNYFNIAEFPAGRGGSGFAYVGRLTHRKGVEIASDVCRHLDVPLVIAGEGDLQPTYGNCVGIVDSAKRAEIMGNACAVFVPTLYVEPFGGVAAEAMLCGTPVITTDFGAFTETVVDGVTGFRCHTLQEFVDAARNAHELDRDHIREYAQSKWSLAAVAPQYERYFERLAGLRGAGWPALRDDAMAN